MINRFRSILRRRFAPGAPFEDPSGDKGWWRAFTGAQAHEVTRLDLFPPGWEVRRQPLRVAALSDFHVGSHRDDPERLAAIVMETNAWQPDIVLLLGDYMNTQILGGGRVPPETIAQILGRLSAGLGIYAVLGNHDWDYDGKAVWRALEDAGIAMLENAHKRIADKGGDFAVVGLADDGTRMPAVKPTLAELPADLPALIMAHDPASFARIPQGPYLTLCGHTHGGQVQLPLFGIVTNSSRAPLQWSEGHIVEDGKHMYVSRGIGTSIIPLRYNCRPEICLLTIGGGSENARA